MIKTLLSIAGFDPTSGAGTTLDIQIFHKLGFAGMGILTALTAQNTCQVKSIYSPPPERLFEQFQTLIEDIPIHGIKIGMLGSQKNIRPVENILKMSSAIPHVVDPVLVSTSGTWFIEPEALPDYVEAMRGRISVITPNAQEASLLTGLRVQSLREIEKAATQIGEKCQAPCIITGGHFKEEAIDVLYDGNELSVFRQKKLDRQVHGTGCFFSSALLAFLVKGELLKKACALAGESIQAHLKRSVKIGHGQDIFKFWD